MLIADVWLDVMLVGSYNLVQDATNCEVRSNRVISHRNIGCLYCLEEFVDDYSIRPLLLFAERLEACGFTLTGP
jgi:hypothetical protein